MVAFPRCTETLDHLDAEVTELKTQALSPSAVQSRLDCGRKCGQFGIFSRIVFSMAPDASTGMAADV